MILINNDYKIIGKDLNIVVESKQVIKDHNLPNRENVGTSRWQTAGYFTNFTSVIDFLAKQDGISEAELEGLSRLTDKVNQAIEDFKNIKVQEDLHLKVALNKDWYMAGTSMFYRTIKREEIQVHRFTKEENVGKDKFINTGAVPNISMGLKSILNECILDFLATGDENSYEELEILIDKIISDSQNLNIEEVSQDSDELENDFDEASDDIEDEEDSDDSEMSN